MVSVRAHVPPMFLHRCDHRRPPHYLFASVVGSATASIFSRGLLGVSPDLFLYFWGQVFKRIVAESYNRFWARALDCQPS
jgi:hypothetical protein